VKDLLDPSQARDDFVVLIFACLSADMAFFILNFYPTSLILLSREFPRGWQVRENKSDKVEIFAESRDDDRKAGNV